MDSAVGIGKQKKRLQSEQKSFSQTGWSTSFPHSCEERNWLSIVRSYHGWVDGWGYVNAAASCTGVCLHIWARVCGPPHLWIHV